MLVFSNFDISVCVFSVSKALERSSATTTVLDGGFFWLKPLKAGSRMLWSAEMVLCWERNPCW